MEIRSWVQKAQRPSVTMAGEDPSFAEFIRRVRAGDERAAMDLVDAFEPAIRRAVRVRLRDPGLRRLIESVDICQSVFASFFVAHSLGQFELDCPDKLIRLLSAIARNKVAFQANREHAARRDRRRVNHGAVLENCPAPGSSPSQQVAARELVQEARKRMTAEERQLLEMREARSRMDRDRNRAERPSGRTPDPSRPRRRADHPRAWPRRRPR